MFNLDWPTYEVSQLDFVTKVLEIHKNYVNRSGFYPSSVPKLSQMSPCTPGVDMDGRIGRV